MNNQEVKRDTVIVLTHKNGRSVIYEESTRTIRHHGKDGISVEIKVPKSFGLTRIFQVMESITNVKL